MERDNFDVTELPEIKDVELPAIDTKSNGARLGIEPLYVVVGQRIRRYRKRRHLTIAQVAQRAKVSRGVVGNLENAKFRTRLDIIEKVAKVLKVELKMLVG